MTEHQPSEQHDEPGGSQIDLPIHSTVSNPYVGPRPFQQGETIYGRTREELELYDLLIAERIVMLHSPSGAGKTSLLQAALLPRLARRRFRVLPTVRVHEALSPEAPSANRYIMSTLLNFERNMDESEQYSIEELAELSLQEYMVARGFLFPPDVEDDSEDNDDEEDEYGGGDANGADKPKRTAHGTGLQRTLLVFDQFEEILTIDPTNRAAKAEFFAQLSEILSPRHIWAIFAIREDYVAALDPYLRPVPTRLQTRFRLDLLSLSVAVVAIQEPARSVDVTFTDAAAQQLAADLAIVREQAYASDEIVEKAGAYIEPVQLQVVCQDLWEKPWTRPNTIDLADIELGAGDVDSALARYYVKKVQATAEQTGVPERDIRTWFSERLLTSQGVRSQVLRGAEQGLDSCAIDALVEAYLVRRDDRRGLTWFELAHDRLVEPVRTNNEIWFEQNLSTFQRRAELWVKNGRAEGWLLQDAELTELIQENPQPVVDWSSDEKDFHAACLSRWKRIQREERDAQRIRLFAFVAVVVAVVAIAASIVAFFQAERARHAQAISFSRELAANSINLQQTDPELSVLLAMKAISVTHTWQAERALHEAIQSDQLLMSLNHDGVAIKSATFSPAGEQILTAGIDGTVRIWNAADGAGNELWEAHEDTVWEAVYNHDGSQIATASKDKTAKIWDAASVTVIYALTGHRADVSGVAFSPDGRHVATGSWDGTVRVWNLESGDLLFLLLGHQGPVVRVAYSADGSYIAAAGDDGTIRVWDTHLGDEQAVLTGHNSNVYDVEFAPNSAQIMSVGWGAHVRLWDIASWQEIRNIQGHTGQILGGTYDPTGGRLATGGEDRSIVVWDAANFTQEHVLRGHDDMITSVAFHPDGKTLVSSSDDGTAKIWQVEAEREVLTHQGHTEVVSDFAFSPDGSKIASVSEDSTVRLWASITDTLLMTMTGHSGEITTVDFDPTGTTVATGGEDQILRMWDVKTGQEHVQTQNTGYWILAVAYSPDGTTVAVGGINGNNSVDIFDKHSGDHLHRLSGHTAAITGLAFLPSGDALISASEDRTVRVWNIDSESIEQTIQTDHSSSSIILNMTISHDGQTLVTVSTDGSARGWNVASGEKLFTLRGHSSRVTDAAFSVDDVTLATVGSDSKIIFWDIANHAALYSLSGHPNGITSIHYSPDGDYLATAGSDKTIRIYAANLSTLKELAQSRIRRDLTPAECKEYLHGEGCASDLELR